MHKMPCKTVVMLLAVLGLSACGKVGDIRPKNNKPVIENVYPAPSCLDTLKDIRQADKCKK